MIYASCAKCGHSLKMELTAVAEFGDGERNAKFIVQPCKVCASKAKPELAAKKLKITIEQYRDDTFTATADYGGLNKPKAIGLSEYDALMNLHSYLKILGLER